MIGVSPRTRSIWRRGIALGWPITVEQTFNTLMRTVDLIVTGLFSPAAVAAVGLADLYMQFPLRIGLGLGSGAITLSSQDTGRGAALTRDQAITQALLIGSIAGIPLMFVGLLFSEPLIALLGAEPEVVRLGGLYLAIIFVAAPMRIVGLVGSRSLQGAEDTRTPMLINGSANALNIVLTVSLGLGIWIAPQLGVVGVALGTLISRTYEATAMIGAIASDGTVISFTRPRDLTITRQLVAVSLPSFAEGMSASLANFPFNALILLFGTEANAAYHIGRRIFQQFSGPFYRSFRTVSSIIVGNALGEGDPAGARYAAKGILALTVLILGSASVFLFVSAGVIGSLFTQDPLTLGYTIESTRVFAVSMPFIAAFNSVAGSLRGGGDTRIPFYARLVGVFGVMLGGSYLLGIVLGFGLLGVYVAIVLNHVSWAIIVCIGFVRGGWEEKGASMMAERSAAEDSCP
jgi:putative MATE family efflux protein